MRRGCAENSTMAGTDEVHALAEAILEAADVADLGVTVSYDDGETLHHIYVNEAAAKILGRRGLELIHRQKRLPRR
jgi:hypothetical protein